MAKHDVIQKSSVCAQNERTSATKAFLHDTPEDWSSIEFRDDNIKSFINSVSETRHQAMQRKSFWRVLRIASLSIGVTDERKTVHEETMPEQHVL